MAIREQRLRAVADFVVIPLAVVLPTLPSPTTAEHLLYIRPHDPNVPDADSTRSLFIANIPTETTDGHLKDLFSNQLGAGRIERIQYETFSHLRGSTRAKKSKKRKRSHVDLDEDIQLRLPTVWSHITHRSGSTAVVTFVDKSSMELSWKAVKKASKQGKTFRWSSEDETMKIKTGSQRYIVNHHATFPPHEQLQQIVEKYMSAFESQEQARVQARTRQRQLPDEDGFITVTRGGRTGPARLEAAQEKLEELKRKSDEKKKGMTDFYRFQNRERRKQEALSLVQRFEADKEKVAALSRKQSGQFKPM